MNPQLTPLGRALLAGAVFALFVGTTTGHMVVGGAGSAMLGLIAAAWFSARVGGRTVAAMNFTLEAPDGPTRARSAELAVVLTLSNPGPRIRELRASLRVAGEPDPSPVSQLDVPAGAEGTLRFDLHFPRAGHWTIHGIELSVGGLLGLTTLQVYRPCELPLNVRPRRLPRGATEGLLSKRGAWRDRAGPHIAREPGSGLELRELRDYVPGDALRIVAWKATARRGRMLVREFEEENIRRLQLLLDVGPTMRSGEIGRTGLDRAVDLCATLAEVGRYDRVGLTTFDSRVYGHLKPAAGRGHVQRQLHHLMDLSRVVDEDLTEISEAELRSRVGAFLEAQEGLNLRRIGEDPWRPAVARTLVDPIGELYNSGALYEAVTRYLAEERDRGHAALFAKSRPAKDTMSARLRLFCALRGLPVPYRLTGATDATERGLVEAINHNLLPGGPQRLILFSDLRSVRSDGPAFRALRLASARKRRVVLVPLGDLPRPMTDALRAARVQVARGW